MVGIPGNPNHDPRTGKFTSGSGHNVSNSTVGERVKGRLSHGVKTVAKYAAAAAGVAAAGVGAAILSGITRPVFRATTNATKAGIDAAAARAERAAAAYGPPISKAVRSAAKKTPIVNSLLKAHEKNMKNAARRQHRAESDSTIPKSKRDFDLPGKFPWKGSKSSYGPHKPATMKKKTERVPGTFPWR